MNFLHLSMLAGLGAMAVPIALHLLSRRQPKLIPFPALRFVKRTVVQQRGSWQLRHFLLLLLRVGILAAFALALARPRVHSAMLTTALGIGAVFIGAIFASLVALIAFVTRRGTGVWLPSAVLAAGLWLGASVWTAWSVTRGPAVPSSDQTAPVAAALIIDTGPSLEYRAENEQRIVAAKAMANWILAKLPLDSRVGLLTNAPLGALALDPSTARSQVDLLQVQAHHVDLAARLRTAVDLVLASGLERREVYIVTDLMRSSWRAASSDLQALLTEHAKEVLVQIIDIGAARTTNWQLSDIELESASVAEGGDAVWRFAVKRGSDTPGNTSSVELVQEQIDHRLPIISNGKLELPASRVVDRQLVDLTQASEAQIQLTARGLSPGSHHFQIKLAMHDPLELDNSRWSTVVCEPQQPALIVADDADVARFLLLALNPQAASDAQEDSSLTQQVRYSQLAQVDLSRYRVVCLNDPPSLPPSTVNLLEQHVGQGGGLLITLGAALGPPEEAAAAPLVQLLPGKPVRVSRRSPTDPSLFLVATSTTHPLFHIFGTMAAEVPWNLYPLYRVWDLESLRPNVQILMTTSDRNLPALMLERRGAGQILTLVTPLPARLESGQASWNALTSGESSWPAFGLLLGSVRYLSGQTQLRTNFTAGETVALPNDPKAFPTTYELYTPQGQSRRIQATDGQLTVGQAEQAGTYHLRGLQGSHSSRGFSVNTPASDTQLDRMSAEDLDALLGAGNYRLARDKTSVESSVGQARYGRELFPLLMACVAALFLAEQAMSNRFYQFRLTPASPKS